MSVLTGLFVRALQEGGVEVKFPDIDWAALMDSHCYILLQKIHAIVCNADKTDAECFMAIEDIVCAFEEMGIDCEGRHDFG